MELFETLKFLSEVSTTVLIAGMALWFWRSRDKGEQRGDEITLKLIALLSDLSANIQASTATLTGVKLATDEVAIEMRREVQTAHVTQIAALDSIKSALDALPEATAGAVKTTLSPDFDQIRAQLQSAVLSISSVCLKLDQMKTVAEDCGEGPDIQPEVVKEGKEPNGN